MLNAGGTVSDSAAKAYKAAVELQLMNVQTVLHIICILPITSNEAERAFSLLKLIKTPCRSTMGIGR